MPERPTTEPQVRLAVAADAVAVAGLFAAEWLGAGDLGRPDVVSDVIARRGGVVAVRGERPVGAVVLAGTDPDTVTWAGPVALADVPAGLEDELIAAAHQVAAEAGFTRAVARVGDDAHAGATVWRDRGYATHGTTEMIMTLPIALWVPDPDRMRALGVRLAELLRAGDLVIASGDLGAGKTTLTQGIGAGLGVDTDVISPTFVLSRVHRSTIGRPDLVHVDAYRLAGLSEIEDLDLDSDAGAVVTVVEWGQGVAEGLNDDRLEITVLRSAADEAGAVGEDSARLVLITPVGERWSDLTPSDLSPSDLSPSDLSPSDLTPPDGEIGPPAAAGRTTEPVS